jgi:D-3-phosphoglycerate dehydrogenase
MWKVLVLGRIHQGALARLRERDQFDVVERPDMPSDLLAQVQDTDVIIVRITPIDRRTIAAAPRLKLVARHGVGYDAVDVAALTTRGIPLAVVGDVNSGAVAEHTLALLLALSKKLRQYDIDLRTGNFSIRDSFSTFELNGRSILIIGFGRIGRKVTKLCQAFGMSVLISDPFMSESDVSKAGATLMDISSALPIADVVSIHAPKMPGTGPIIGAAELRAMKEGAVLINVARGGMVDEAALVEALLSGHLAGAGLDVFDTEPLPHDHPLVFLPSVVLTPHSAAFTAECVRRMGDACVNNVLSFAADRLDPALVVNRADIPNF